MGIGKFQGGLSSGIEFRLLKLNYDQINLLKFFTVLFSVYNPENTILYKGEISLC